MNRLDLLSGSNKYEDKTRYQKIAYEYAIQLYKDDQYQQAETYFDRSLQERINDEYTALATFWKAESAFQQARYQGSRYRF